MNARVRRYYERGQRCDKVTDARAEDFPAGSNGAVQAALVKEELATLAALDVERATSTGKRQQGSAGRQEVREALREAIAAFTATADVIAGDRLNMKGMFEFPRGDYTDQTLIATARSFADRAVSLVELFTMYGLPETFLAGLRSKADELESFISLQNEGVGARVNANAAVREHVLALNKALARLDVIYHNKYVASPSVLAEWESAYHLEAAPGSKRKTAPPPTNGDAPPATPANS